MTEIALVYMVAGLSSRFGGKIKGFVEVGPNNESLIEYSLNQALPAGFTKIIFIVGKSTEQSFKEKFGDNYKGIPIQYALQEYDETKRNKPWGTTDALLSAKELLDCPLVVCNGDDIYGEESFKIAVEKLNQGENVTAGYKLGKVIPEEGTTNRGIYHFKENSNELNYIEEVMGISTGNLSEKNLTKETLVSMTLFALQQEVLHLLKENLEKFKQENLEDRKAECLLPEELGNLIKENKINMKVYPTNDQWFGVTNPGDEIQVQRTLEQK